MVWVGIGVVVVLAALWATARPRSRTATRVAQPADPFVDRRSMVAYHRALRSGAPTLRSGRVARR